MRKYLLLPAAFLAASSLYGATQVKEVWGTYGGNGFFNWESKESVAYGVARRRSDTERSRLFSSSPEVRVDIERIDLDKRWEIDPARKRYTEESISAAREKALKDAEKSRQEWEKQQKKAANKKEEEPKIRIRSAETKTTGPGPAETINGFSCRPYTVVTTLEYESLPDHKLVGRQSYYEKQWTTDAPVLARFRKDELAYWQLVSAGEQKNQDVKALQEAVKKEYEKYAKDPSVNPWMSYWSALEKIKGYPVRTLSGFTIAPTDAGSRPAAAAPSASAQDNSLVQPGDLSGGVGGLVSGIATRWASKKVEKKVQDKMAEHPAWVDEVAKDVNGEVVGWGWMSEIKSAQAVDSPDLFDLPPGLKQVKSL